MSVTTVCGTSPALGSQGCGAPAIHVAQLSAGIYVPFPVTSDEFRYVLSHG